MVPRKPQLPTNGELSILQVLWERGPCTVREVQEELDKGRPTGYTTVLKLMQIMTDKGLVRRDESQRTHVYVARLTQEQTQRQLLRDLMDRAFEGSAGNLVMRALTEDLTTEDELTKIRKLLEEREEETP
ncbi:MAG: BlaI/MecI/CopY family transcriptional regulator [Planctomycetes bacterium]|nr:BlaI/MecI/CopY family transcriptional regulator [Planctomycetota bacterium]